MNYTPLIAICLSLAITSCQSTENLLSQTRDFLNPQERNLKLVNDAIGKKENYLTENFGPARQTLIFKDFKLLYYNKNVFFSVNGDIQNYSELSTIKYDVSLESLSRPGARDFVASVIIVSGKDNIPTESLEFVDYTSPIAEMVGKSGLFRFPKRNEAPDQIVLISYGISDPIVDTKVWSEPVYTWVPNTTVTSSYTNYYGQTGHITSTANDGGLRYAGSTTRYSTETNYNRFLSIVSIDGKAYLKNKTIKEIWKVKMASYGPTANLKKAISSMAISSYPYWGYSTDGLIRTFSHYEDPGLEYLAIELAKTN